MRHARAITVMPAQAGIHAFPAPPSCQRKLASTPFFKQVRVFFFVNKKEAKKTLKIQFTLVKRAWSELTENFAALFLTARTCLRAS
jgi:hypothetical protein